MTSKTWTKLTFDEKKIAVRARRERGLSDEDIGNELRATKGQVVGFRHRHLPELTGKERSVSPRKTAQPPKEPLSRTRSIHVSKDVSPAKPVTGILADPPSRPKLTTNEALMCTYVDPGDKKRCSFLYEDAHTRRCRLHPL